MTQPKTPSSSPDRIFAPRKSKGYDLSVAATALRTASEAWGLAMLRARREGSEGCAAVPRAEPLPPTQPSGPGPTTARGAGASHPGTCRNIPNPAPPGKFPLCAGGEAGAGMEMCSLPLTIPWGWVRGHLPPWGLGGVIIVAASHQAGKGCRGALLQVSRKDRAAYGGSGATAALAVLAVPCRASPALAGRSTSARGMEPGSWGSELCLAKGNVTAVLRCLRPACVARRQGPPAARSQAAGMATHWSRRMPAVAPR